ncbi:MAG: EutN/CcmL family microcompartment protein [Planctomycetes bacterium]|nr:EutN/CcmL family microcompartment protein [Planctomycetota bacterium]
MQLARVVGRLHATRKDPALASAKLLVLQGIDPQRRERGGRLVAVDTVGAGPGEIVFYTTANEALLPWQDLTGSRAPALVDASIIGIVDDLVLPETES